jgi:hypothetical protein
VQPVDDWGYLFSQIIKELSAGVLEVDPDSSGQEDDNNEEQEEDNSSITELEESELVGSNDQFDY